MNSALRPRKRSLADDDQPAAPEWVVGLRNKLLHKAQLCREIFG